MFDVTLVTYEGQPDVTPDDWFLANELRRRRLRVRASVWSDRSVDWSDSRITMLRSTWDYFHREAEFRDWLRRVDGASRLVNRRAAILWNMDKRYLRDLSDRGIAIVPTRFVEPGEPVDLTAAAERFGAPSLVIKPTVSGASYGTRRFDLPGEADAAQRHLSALAERGGAMVQPYVSSVEPALGGERSLVFLGGRFSHAYLKHPFVGMASGDARPNPQHRPSDDELLFAREVLASAGGRLHYARVDVVLGPVGPLLMELELIEPALLFAMSTESASMMADELVALLNADGRVGDDYSQRAQAAGQEG